MYYKGLIQFRLYISSYKIPQHIDVIKKGLLLSSFRESANNISYEYFTDVRYIMRYFDVSGKLFFKDLSNLFTKQFGLNFLLIFE